MCTSPRVTLTLLLAALAVVKSIMEMSSPFSCSTASRTSSTVSCFLVVMTVVMVMVQIVVVMVKVVVVMVIVGGECE